MKRIICLCCMLILMTGIACTGANDKAYSVLVVDESDNPVNGVTVKFCSDTECVLGTTGSDGIAVFETDKAGKYTVQMIKVPEGYAEDGTEYETDKNNGQLKVVLKK